MTIFVLSSSGSFLDLQKMEKHAASTVTDLACVTALNLNSPPPPLSPISEKSFNNKHQEEFAASFASLYNSIFSPESQFPISLSLSPSPPSSSSPPARVDTTTEHRLRQARLILEYDELTEHYELCLNRLQSLMTELDSLRRENDALRYENSDLLKLIHISTSSSSSSSISPPPIHNRQFHHQISDFDAIHKHSRSAKRNSLPKSISVRSPGYLKINQGRSHGFGASDRQTSQLSTDSVISHFTYFNYFFPKFYFLLLFINDVIINLCEGLISKGVCTNKRERSFRI